MTARILDTREDVKALREQLSEQAGRVADSGTRAALRVVLIGSDEDNEIYARKLSKTADRIGIAVSVDRHPDDMTSPELLSTISELNQQQILDGVVVGMPVPRHLSEVVASVLDPRKDVDGFTEVNAGRLYLGIPGHVPSTAAAILHIVKQQVPTIRGCRTVVVGRSAIVGKPAALMLLREGASVTMTHTGTRDLGAETRRAEILVVAAGQPGLITEEMVKPGAVVIDAGINVVDDGITGDVDVDSVSEVASAITPVPGGVGPLTALMVLRQVLENALERTDG